MHDFCFTIPYGILVLVGGIVGYVKRGSTASLAGGAGSGLVLLIAGVLSLKAFEKRRISYIALILETVVAFALTWIMGQRYVQTSKIMPAGIVAALRNEDLRRCCEAGSWYSSIESLKVAWNIDLSGEEFLQLLLMDVFIKMQRIK
ncbi:hypothetical protein AAC387_Pa10g0641 [Persea americana]